MTDFRKAFARGQTAARDADLVRTEVGATLDLFMAQVHEASGNVLVVQRGQLSAPKSGGTTSTAIRIIPKMDDAIVVARSDAPDKPQELFRYEFADAGYPVTLRYAGGEERCHNKSALEAGLEKILANPNIGRMLAQLMDSPRAA